MKTSTIVYAALVLSLALVSCSICLAETDRESAQAQAAARTGPVVTGNVPSGDVFVGSEFAMRIPASAGGFSPARRAEIVASRLNDAFAAGHVWEDMRVIQVDSEWTVTMDGRLIVTADTRSARAMKVSPGSLANRWARTTVVALGGQPKLIAQQLEPIPARVAGVQEELAANWSTSPAKTVPLLNATTGNEVGRASVAGPPDRLNLVNAVALYEHSADGANVRTFVPITATSVTDQVTRVHVVGLVAVPCARPMAGVMRGEGVPAMVTRLGTTWDSTINSRLASWNLRVRASTKVVPLYSMDDGECVGAAQVVGTTKGVPQTQAVAATMREGIMHLMATAARPPVMGEPTPLNDVVVSSLIDILETTPPAAPPMPPEEAEAPPGPSGQGC